MELISKELYLSFCEIYNSKNWLSNQPSWANLDPATKQYWMELPKLAVFKYRSYPKTKDEVDIKIDTMTKLKLDSPV